MPTPREQDGLEDRSRASGRHGRRRGAGGGHLVGPPRQLCQACNGVVVGAEATAQLVGHAARRVPEVVGQRRAPPVGDDLGEAARDERIYPGPYRQDLLFLGIHFAKAIVIKQ